MDEYKKKYIDTGSLKPLTDVMIGLFFFSYAVAWPQVRSNHPRIPDDSPSAAPRMPEMPSAKF